MKLNGEGKSHALSLIEAGKVDTTSDWSFDASDSDKLLGNDDWTAYGKWFLGVDPSQAADTKGHYHYPFGKDGKVYASALRAAASRAGQNNEEDIGSAASDMLAKIKAAEDKSTDNPDDEPDDGPMDDPEDDPMMEDGKAAKPKVTVTVSARKTPAVGAKLYKAAQPDVNETDRTITFVASDESVDRYGDIIRASGWQLDNFQRNPVLLFGHDSSCPPIGRVTSVAVKAKKLMATCEFMPQGMYDFADQIWEMVKAKFLNAVSVGFIPTVGPNMIRDDKNEYVTGYEFIGQELVELSVVPVPANPNALAVAKKFGIGEERMKQIFLQFDKFAEEMKKQRDAEAEAERGVARIKNFHTARRLDLVRLGGSST